MNVMTLSELFDTIENDSAAYTVYLAQKKVATSSGIFLHSAIVRNTKSRTSYIVLFSYAYAILIDIGDVNIVNAEPIIKLFENRNIILRGYSVLIYQDEVEVFADDVSVRIKSGRIDLKDVNRALDSFEMIKVNRRSNSPMKLEENNDTVTIFLDDETQDIIALSMISQACAAVVAQYIASTM